MSASAASSGWEHDHVFLGVGHEKNERRTWIVIALCAAMMAVEIVGGLLFGSIALVADGLHMSTHAGALLLAALAYLFSRRYSHDRRFSFGTGKLGDLAGFTSAVVLVMIALLIGYESVMRLVAPVPIHFAEAIPIAGLGLAVNIASAWLLSGGHDHHHHHASGVHEHGHDEAKQMIVGGRSLVLSIFEDGVPPRFRLSGPTSGEAVIETLRGDGARQLFRMVERDGFLESSDEVPEPHAFEAAVTVGGERRSVLFEEHDHSDHHRDNNMRAAVIHVLADAAVSVMVIVGLMLARVFGWLWMDAVAGLVGALVIASWSYGLIRDTGAILLDMTPDRALAERLRGLVEAGGDHLADLHLWRLGPGHLGAILAVTTASNRDARYYRERLGGLSAISHLTIEVQHTGPT
jgi:cation diffusion facilitator family transporter